MCGELGSSGSGGAGEAAIIVAGGGGGGATGAVGSSMTLITALETPAAFRLFNPATEVSKEVVGAFCIFAMITSSERPALANPMTSSLDRPLGAEATFFWIAFWALSGETRVPVAIVMDKTNRQINFVERMEDPFG
jgi:hypothetical protein